MNNNWLNIEWDKNFSMWSTINNIVLGEANLSAENSGKPLRGQGSAPNPAGELWTLPRPQAGGEEAWCPSQEPHPTVGLDFRLFGPHSAVSRQSSFPNA